MFYISKVVGSGKDKKYGITDTSDGVTELYSGKEIIDFVFRQGIEIKGVEARQGYRSCIKDVVIMPCKP